MAIPSQTSSERRSAWKSRDVQASPIKLCVGGFWRSVESRLPKGQLVTSWSVLQTSLVQPRAISPPFKATACGFAPVGGDGACSVDCWVSGCCQHQRTPDPGKSGIVHEDAVSTRQGWGCTHILNLFVADIYNCHGIRMHRCFGESRSVHVDALEECRPEIRA